MSNSMNSTNDNNNNNDNLLPLASTSLLPPKVLSNVAEVLKTIKETELLVVYFYAKWCGTCKRADPLYNHASQIWSSSLATFTRFDCELEEKLCEETFDLFYVPSWKIWRGGELVANIEGDWTEFEPKLISLIGTPTNRVELDEATERMMEGNREKFIDLSNSIKERKRSESEKDSSRGTSHSRTSDDSEVSEMEV